MLYAEQTLLKRAFYNTSHVEPSRRTRTLKKRLRPVANLSFEGEKSPAVSLATFQLGPMLVACFTSDAIEFVRNQDVFECGQFDEYFLLILLVRGDVHGTFDNRNFVLRSGDICIVDLSKSVRLQTSGCEMVNIFLRRDALCSSEVDLHGRVLPNGGLRCRMLTAHLERLTELLSSATVPYQDVLMNTTIAVIRHCLQITQIGMEAPQPWLDELRNRILAYIEDHLMEPDLDATHIRRAFRISRAHLYRLFPEYGGIQRYIRTRRLDSAFRDLCENPDQLIAWVAENSGFANERQFQRAFLRRFEMTPSELRKKHRLERPERKRARLN